MHKWEEEDAKRKRILRNICEYDYIIDQPTPMSQATHYPKSTKEGGRADSESSTFLPKLNTNQGSNTAGGPLGTAPDTMKKKPGLIGSTVSSVGSTGYATSMGPFYKKRGYAASQMEMRRESSNSGYGGSGSKNPRTQVVTANNQIALLNHSVGYERSANLYSGKRDLGAGTGGFLVEIFLTRKR